MEPTTSKGQAKGGIKQRRKGRKEDEDGEERRREEERRGEGTRKRLEGGSNDTLSKVD